MKIFDQFFYHHDKSNSESKSRNTWLRVFNSTSNRHLCINTENGRLNLTDGKGNRAFLGFTYTCFKRNSGMANSSGLNRRMNLPSRIAK